MNGTKTKQTIAAPAASQVTTERKEARPTTFVVTRDGYRVSDREYADRNDQAAIAEREFWTIIANNYSYGESVGIVQYDSKKHRVW